jgi:hypothetical protein
LIVPSNAALLSLVVSAATAGYTSAVLAYEIDIDPKWRRLAPEVLGIVPDASIPRSLNFVSMVLLSALMLAIRSFGMIMLNLVGTKYAVGYWACDLALYLLYKVARGDLRHSVPIHGALGLFFSVLERIVMKNTVDFTGCIVLRVPAEMGGFYWAFNVIMSIATGYASIPFYFGNAEKVVLDEKATLTYMMCLGGGWLASFAVFLATMNRKYIGTFFSFTAGFQITMQRFLDEENSDEERASIATRNRLHWEIIRPQVRDFFHNHWNRWEEEQPEWFTANFKERLDDDLLPPAELVRQKAAGGGHRRRSSAFEGLLGDSGEGVGVAQVAPEPPV